MRTGYSIILLMLGCIALAGCGGCESAEARMRRRALRNTPDEVEPAPTPTAADQPPATADEQATAAPPNATPAPAPQPDAAPSTAALPAPPAATTSATPPAAVPPPAIAAKTAVPVARPVQPLSAGEEHARAIENLREIGKAILAYSQRTGTLPPAAIRDGRESPILSWRVFILPDLGYGELYRQFHHNEPWNSSHNKKLLPLIPSEFVSASRYDTKTNVLGLALPGQAFDLNRVHSLEAIRDGMENTALVVEVDDAAAVPWTKPADFVVDSDDARINLRSLRPGGALALLGNGRVVTLGSHLQDDKLRALFSLAGNDAPGLGQLLTDASVETTSAETTLSGAASDAAASNYAASAIGEETPAPAATAIPPSPDDPLVGLPGDPVNLGAGQMPLPTAQQAAAARELFREVYGERYEKAKKPAERQKLAQSLLAEADKVSANSVHYYELLRITRDIAVAGGDAETALKAVDLIIKNYEVDQFDVTLKALEDLGKTIHEPNSNEAACQRSRGLLRETIEADRFVEALRAYDVLLECLRKTRDRNQVAWLQKQRQPLEAMQTAFRDAVAAAVRLKQDPADSAARETVGKYLCFVKNQWPTGLPHLRQAGDIKLRVLAAVDLESPRTPAEAYSLAEQYWQLAEELKEPFARGLELRAAYYYQLALDQMLGGLEKVKALQRIQEARQLHGPEEIERVLGTLAPQAAAGE